MATQVNVYNNNVDGFISYLSKEINSSHVSVEVKVDLQSDEKIEVFIPKDSKLINYQLEENLFTRGGYSVGSFSFDLAVQVDAGKISITIGSRKYYFKAVPTHKKGKSLLDLILKKSENWKEAIGIDNHELNSLKEPFYFEGVSLPFEDAEVQKFIADFSLFNQWVLNKLEVVVVGDIESIFKNQLTSESGMYFKPLQQVDNFIKIKKIN